MAFKFRLETSLRLANQEMDIAQGQLAQELRVLRTFSEQRDYQLSIFLHSLEGQKKACLMEPQNLSLWLKFSLEQKEKLSNCEKRLQEQEKIVAKYRENLVECRIKVEKFKRLKEKQLKLYEIEELKKEQGIIDEVAQSRTGWR
ncbi:MAG: flagellar export protein FliJ [Peptococcaceae bacterium]|nr:flagellar export protein FliJ [Peptococcaceae bacterium]